MRITLFGRALAATLLAVGATVPAVASSAPAKTELLPTVDLTCDVFSQVDFALHGGTLGGIYTSTHRNCVSPNPAYQKYSSFLAVAPAIQVTGCPQTGFSGSADLTWVNREELTLEPGTADYALSATPPTLSLTVTSGPFAGDRLVALVAPVPTGVLTCPNGLPTAQRILIQGQQLTLGH
ncbi:hypothetical protein NDR87_31140 [Nocardia sp. CDC159]|uniref:Secreted protein n=1 Tax=Nocardia pulmonis TaxID=2951408 RepID=A0A9X2EFH0_9NOCA|nr:MULTISPECIES: hypothetical protein [Nocardia]MCM6777993.1 hypothetical protein [Nocardia pulmonis]MCM6790836.1 hypothetical protein [Nocardia sp. CDC159]